MPELTTLTHVPFALVCILGVTLVTTAFPQPRITLTDSSEVLKQDDWEIIFPSVALSDWTVQMMSTPSLREEIKAGLKRGTWLLAPGRPEASEDHLWPTLWSPAGTGMKRSVVADDAAFRERSKLLTSMERQKWLNSYMQKLLVVNSSG